MGQKKRFLKVHSYVSRMEAEAESHLSLGYQIKIAENGSELPSFISIRFCNVIGVQDAVHVGGYGKTKKHLVKSSVLYNSLFGVFGTPLIVQCLIVMSSI